jgi:hypothetical protein
MDASVELTNGYSYCNVIDASVELSNGYSNIINTLLSIHNNMSTSLPLVHSCYNISQHIPQLYDEFISQSNIASWGSNCVLFRFRGDDERGALHATPAGVFLLEGKTYHCQEAPWDLPLPGSVFTHK